MTSSILDLTKKEDAHIHQRLNENVIGWLTTVRPDGRPHAVAVWFLWDGETILIFSKPHQQKLRNLQHNPHVLLLIDDTHQGNDPIVIEGTAALLPASEAAVTKEAYVQKYGTRIKGIGFTPETMAAAYSQPVRIVPTKIY